ncbi:hypothetical protein ACWEH1_27965 [Micromonospora chersina]
MATAAEAGCPPARDVPPTAHRLHLAVVTVPGQPWSQIAQDPEQRLASQRQRASLQNHQSDRDRIEDFISRENFAYQEATTRTTCHSR